MVQCSLINDMSASWEVMLKHAVLLFHLMYLVCCFFSMLCLLSLVFLARLC